MTSKLEDSVRGFDKKQAKDVPEIKGLLGLPIGGSKQVEVPNRNAYVYVRLRENQSEVIQAFNETISPVYDMPVIVIRRGNSYYVKGRDTDRFTNWGDSSPYLPLHGNSHSFNPDSGGGGDLVFVFPRQFMPALTIPSGTSGGPNVIVTDYNLHLSNGGWLHVGPTGTDNILQYKPTDSTAIMGLVYIDSVSGNPYFIINSGTTFANTITGSAEIVPYLPVISNPTWIPDMAVRLTSGTYSIGWDNLYDVRQFIEPTTAGGGSGSFPILGANKMVLTDSGGLPIDGPNTTWDSGLNTVTVNTNGQFNGNLDVQQGINIPLGFTYDVDNIPHTHTGTGGGFSDAPFDAYVYGRHSGTWDIVQDKYWIIYPEQITSQQDDWNPVNYTSTTRLLQITSNASQNITGIIGGVLYRRLYFYNPGSFNFVFKEHDGSSASANQFDMSTIGGGDFTLGSNGWVAYQYESFGGGDWLFWSSGTGPTNLPMDRVVVTDPLGRQSASDIFTFNPADKQLVFGANGNFQDLIGGGVSFHIVDDKGSTGGEEFLWAYGTGTLGLPASQYQSRRWFVRSREAQTNDTAIGIVNQDELGQIIPLAIGDNGSWNAASEINSPPEVTHKANITFRAFGEHNDTSRAIQTEFWNTPSGTINRQKSFVIQDAGGVNLPSGTSTYNVAGVPHVHQGQGARVYRSGTVSSNPDVTISFDTKEFDTDNMFNISNPTRLTCKTSGKYVIIGCIGWSPSATGIRSVQIQLNAGLIVIARQDFQAVSAPGFSTTASLSTIYDLNVGDYIQLYAYQNTGIPLSLNTISDYCPVLAMERVG